MLVHWSFIVDFKDVYPCSSSISGFKGEDGYFFGDCEVKRNFTSLGHSTGLSPPFL